MENRLNEIFSNVNNWLKFAEAKNGVLLSLNGAALIGVLSYLKDAPKPVLHSLTWALIPSFIIATVILIFSFLPVMDVFFKRKRDLKNPNVSNYNLIYYGDVRKLEPKTYLNNLYESVTGSTQEVLAKFELDIAKQIINNAEITYRKLQYFKIGFTIDIIGIIAGLLIFIIPKVFPTICQ